MAFAARADAKISPMTTVPPIRTERFELVSMSLPFMRALHARDMVTATAEIGASIPPDMSDDLKHFLEYRIGDLSADPTIQPWLGRVIVLDADGDRRIIGSVGFHSPPDGDDRVEVGYRVEPEHRRQGVATEVVRALLDWAWREHGVTRFRAATAPENVASQGVLAQFGFRRTGIQMDEYDGPEIIFELDGWPPRA
jgi:RimJ/RimL family protein N-acetyltransferase